MSIKCSRKLRSALAGMALVSSVVIASAQQAPIRTDTTGLAVAPAAALPRSEHACPHIPLVCELLADPAIRNFVGVADYAWDFNEPNGSSSSETSEVTHRTDLPPSFVRAESVPMRQ